jgi:hypothetical protein
MSCKVHLGGAKAPGCEYKAAPQHGARTSAVCTRPVDYTRDLNTPQHQRHAAAIALKEPASTRSHAIGLASHASCRALVAAACARKRWMSSHVVTE